MRKWRWYRISAFCKEYETCKWSKKDASKPYIGNLFEGRNGRERERFTKIKNGQVITFVESGLK